MSEDLKTTALNKLHRSLGARMVPFAGYDMPVQYGSIKEEHAAVREAAGLFDLQHMGRILIRGRDRMAFLDKLVTNQVDGLETGAARYGLVCNASGNVLDDVIYYIFPEQLVLVVNASNREKILTWIEAQRAGFDAHVEDVTDEWGMVALQGPKARAILQPLTDLELKTVKGYRAAGGMVMGVPCMVAATGYTGEAGYELYFDARRAEFLFETLLTVGKDEGLKACGLGARDTLRLEAGMPLYGHELDEQTNPLEAGLDFAVKLDKDFTGVKALRKVKESGRKKRLCGFFLEGRKIAREGKEIFRRGEDKPCGVVTSGTFSPTLDRSVCMAYVEGDPEGEPVFEVGFGKKRVALERTKLPFYKRKKKKRKKKKAAPAEGAGE